MTIEDKNRMIMFIQQQKKDFTALLNNSKGKYDPQKISMLEGEIERLDERLKKYQEELKTNV
jgi:chaperonin cofactor prefoldin